MPNMVKNTDKDRVKLPKSFLAVNVSDSNMNDVNPSGLSSMES